MAVRKGDDMERPLFVPFNANLESLWWSPVAMFGDFEGEISIGQASFSPELQHFWAHNASATEFSEGRC